MARQHVLVLFLTVLPAVCGWALGPALRVMHQQYCASHARAIVVAQAGAAGGEDGDLDALAITRLALQAAIQREDYDEAARLKKDIDASEELSTAAEDSASAELVDSKSIDKMLESAGKEGIVVLHFTSAEQGFANSLVARTASRYAASQMVGGPVCGFVQLSEAGFERLGGVSLGAPSSPAAAAAGGLLPGWRAVFDKKSGREYYYNEKSKETTWDKPVTEAYRAAARLCAERGVRSLPTTQVWRGGALVREVSSAELEAELLKLGAKCAAGGSFATGNEKLRDRNVGTGLPSADAVDEIDFTGGVAGAGGTALDRFKGRDRGTTRSYLPDFVDKPGDDMKDGKPPEGPPGTLRKGPDWIPKRPGA